MHTLWSRPSLPTPLPRLLCEPRSRPFLDDSTLSLLGSLRARSLDDTVAQSTCVPRRSRTFELKTLRGTYQVPRGGLWKLVYAMVSGDVDADVEMEARDCARLWDGLGALPEEVDLPRTGTEDDGVYAMIVSPLHIILFYVLLTSIMRQKSVVIIGIIMHSRNQHCNDFQCTTGLFLHSCGAPDKLIRVLSRMGISISVSSINRAVQSLSHESHDIISAKGETRTYGIAYDNLDVMLRGQSTIDNPRAGLIHLASATMIQLAHGVTVDDLRCSTYIRSRQDLRMNPLATDPQAFNPLSVLEFMCRLHPQGDHPSGLSRNGRFVAWLFLSTLTRHGPAPFHEYRKHLSLPESVEQIPLAVLDHQPLPILDIDLSTNSGNIRALDSYRELCGVESDEDLADIVQMTFGDLGTYEHVLSALKQRSQEHTQCNRLEYVVFVLGLFHLKMAAADALWRVLVPSKGHNTDHEATSFAKYISILRPDETGKLFSKAEFRQQHELIYDVGSVLRLDTWTAGILKRYQGRYHTLEEFAASRPKLAELEDIAMTLARDYCAGESSDFDIFALRRFPENAAARDEQNENTMLVHQYLALYQHLSYAMDAGDIGMVETLLPAWIHIFRATGKHKYANRVLLFMHSLYFVYPKGLRYVI